MVVQVEDLKAETQGKVRRSLTNREHQIKEQAKQKRDDAAIGREQMSADEMAFKLKAERAKAYAAESRANAARIKAEMTKQRQMDVTAQDRAASQRVAQAKRALLESNREKRRAVFGSRYVDRDMALTFERSDYKKLYAMDVRPPAASPTPWMPQRTHTHAYTRRAAQCAANSPSTCADRPLCLRCARAMYRTWRTRRSTQPTSAS